MKLKTLFFICYAATGLQMANPLAAQDWELFEETSIRSQISGSIKKGHIFQTTSGNIYEVIDYVYLYEYEYSPKVIVLRNGPLYKLVIEGFDEPLLCKRLNEETSTSSKNSKQREEAFESFIVNEFTGLEQGNIYKLANGQIWEQTEPWIWVWIWVNPKVLIWKSGSVYKMKVENIDHAITIRRIK